MPLLHREGEQGRVLLLPFGMVCELPMLDLSNLRSAVACRSSTSRPAVHQPLPDCYSHTTEDNTVDKLVVGRRGPCGWAAEPTLGGSRYSCISFTSLLHAVHVSAWKCPNEAVL